MVLLLSFLEGICCQNLIARVLLISPCLAEPKHASLWTEDSLKTTILTWSLDQKNFPNNWDKYPLK